MKSLALRVAALAAVAKRLRRLRPRLQSDLRQRVQTSLRHHRGRRLRRLRRGLRDYAITWNLPYRNLLPARSRPHDCAIFPLTRPFPNG
jgi:hypothetical protein